MLTSTFIYFVNRIRKQVVKLILIRIPESLEFREFNLNCQNPGKFIDKNLS
jgi:hypothetical protein